jgi:hypothetical protein
MAGGIAFIATSLVGGFVSSVGTDVYHSLRNVFSNQSGPALSFPQVIFLIIGIAGLGLMLSGLFGANSKPRVRRKS